VKELCFLKKKNPFQEGVERDKNFKEKSQPAPSCKGVGMT